MKVGILTHFHNSVNYGGVLQAYALCEFLNKNGHDASQILYLPKMTLVSDSSLTIKDVCRKVVLRLNKKIYKKRNRGIKARMEQLFIDFRNNVPHTEREYTKADIAETNDIFDVFITGSDQVWNPFWHDSNYLLSFVKDNSAKLSYAASIGVGQLDKAQEKLYPRYLSTFKALSVRESTASDVLSPLLDKQVQVCVDPTLLLTAEEWDNVAARRKIKEKYVFLYLLGEDKKTRKLAEKFAEAKGIKLVTIPDLLGAYRHCDRRLKAEKIMDATPSDFISLIKYADYIITDSFHACVFSLLYKKQFFAFQRDNKIKMESRIQNLTQMFGCPERFCTHDEVDIKQLMQMSQIDYTNMINQFEKEKQKSVDYLNSNLSK
ncbi:MAG: polysaccharide pyruvyl transferase family protein [Clostridia bacterium]|nr:polysaccharide pyruvyl transferase family protein [Clostridia bacterium]